VAVESQSIRAKGGGGGGGWGVSDAVREAAGLLLVGETESSTTTRTENIKHFE